MLETQEITHVEVLRAGRVLYGPAFAAEGGAWRETLKATYRRRAMETHPDRARSLGRSERELSREFKAVADAYRVLARLGAGALPRPPANRPPPAPPRPRPQRARAAERQRQERPPEPPPQPRSAGRWKSGNEPPRRSPVPTGGPRVRVGVRPQDLPQRRLRFAEYLYYSGRVGWSELVESIAWQRSQRPPIGRIAVDFGFLEPGDVAAILERRRRVSAPLPFGEWAVHEGFLTSYQLLAVIGQQLRLQRPIGQFFVERGLIDADEIDHVRRRILRHNSRFLDVP